MNKTEYLIPLHNLLVRDPVNMNPLSPKGEWKPMVGKIGKFWRRRLKDKSVMISTPPGENKTQKGNK